MQPLPVERPVIEVVNVGGRATSGITFRAEGVTCVLGGWDRDKEELSRFLTLEEKPREGGVRFPFDDPRRHIRLIPRERIDAELKVREVLRLYERRFGKGSEVWAEVLGIDGEKKVGELSEMGKFRLELLQLFYGDTRFVVAEDFVDTIEEQFRARALKDLLKAVKYVKATLVVFMGTFRFQEVCERKVVLYGGKVLEVAEGGKLFHPYSVALSKVRLDVGKRGEKVVVPYVGDPANYGCPFHPYCENRDRELRRKCVSSLPPLFQVEGNQVRCWLYQASNKGLGGAECGECRPCPA